MNKTRRNLLILFGLVLLMGAVTIAVPFIQNRQEIRQRAAPNNNPQFPNFNQQRSPTVRFQATGTSTPTITPKQDQYTAPNDIVQPTITALNLVNGAQVKANTQVELSATASDNTEVGNVEFLINGTLICSSGAPYTCNWTVPAQPKAQYVVTIRAYDLTGNVTSKSIVVRAF